MHNHLNSKLSWYYFWTCLAVKPFCQYSCTGSWCGGRQTTSNISSQNCVFGCVAAQTASGSSRRRPSRNMSRGCVRASMSTGTENAIGVCSPSRYQERDCADFFDNVQTCIIVIAAIRYSIYVKLLVLQKHMYVDFSLGLKYDTRLNNGHIELNLNLNVFTTVHSALTEPTIPDVITFSCSFLKLAIVKQQLCVETCSIRVVY